MSKKEMQKALIEAIKEIQNKETFCKAHDVEIMDFYPYALGYFQTTIAMIAFDNDIVKACKLIG